MNKEDTIMHFFYGEVMLFEQLLFTAKYVVMRNGMELEIDNSMHIRLVEEQMHLPQVFHIIAPLIAIKHFKGSIPVDLVIQKPASEYLQLRLKHHGV